MGVSRRGRWAIGQEVSGQRSRRRPAGSGRAGDWGWGVSAPSPPCLPPGLNASRPAGLIPAVTPPGGSLVPVRARLHLSREIALPICPHLLESFLTRVLLPAASVLLAGWGSSLVPRAGTPFGHRPPQTLLITAPPCRAAAASSSGKKPSRLLRKAGSVSSVCLWAGFCACSKHRGREAEERIAAARQRD